MIAGNCTLRPIVFGTALMTVAMTARAQSVEQWTSWGDASMEKAEYYGASRFYDGALAIEPGRMALQWKQAEACRLSNQYDKAEVLYERVHQKDMGRTYPDALRWLGEMQLCNERYDEAQRTWERLLRKERDKGSFNASRARNALSGCAMAIASGADRDVAIIDHLQAPINTFDSEFGARIGPDSALYFSSLRGALDDNEVVKDTTTYHTSILRSHRAGDLWNVPEPLPAPINGIGDNGNTTWTIDGKWILFTRCMAGAPCRIHMAEITPNGYGPAIPLPGLGDDLHSTQPMVTRIGGHDSMVLFFASDRDGGSGGMDIWQAHLMNGEAVDVHVLPPPVNTPGNERCPWYEQQGNVLWFSSDFHPGFGAYDIFTAPLGNDEFGPVDNVGRPLNGPANDLYPMYDPSRNEGWFTSNRVGSFAAKGKTCCNDLYRFQWRDRPATEASIARKDSSLSMSSENALARLQAIAQRPPLKLYFHNDDPDPRSWATTTTQDYATTYRRYRALIPEYERHGNASELRPFFQDEVDKGFLELAELTIALRDVLTTGANVQLEVRGHASPLARNNYNRNLSERRIASLRNHLRIVDGGALAPYLDGHASNGASLSVLSLPYGEEQADTGVNDDLYDLFNSVYSVAASRERRIEIEEIRTIQNQSVPIVETIRKDLGIMEQERELRVTFSLHNPGTADMRLLDSKADCGCTTAKLPKEPVAPGGSVDIELVFNGHAPLGELRRSVMIRTNARPERFELVIEGTIVP